MTRTKLGNSLLFPDFMATPSLYYFFRNWCNLRL